jgi:hypothetical protein
MATNLTDNTQQSVTVRTEPFGYVQVSVVNAGYKRLEWNGRCPMLKLIPYSINPYAPKHY